MGIKVTREMLDRYRKLKQEIPVLELELLMMKNTEAGLGNDTIFDYQTGYPRPQSVVGFDQKKYDRPGEDSGAQEREGQGHGSMD